MTKIERFSCRIFKNTYQCTRLVDDVICHARVCRCSATAHSASVAYSALTRSTRKWIMSSYKYCIVPRCENTSVATPEKLFFCVPKDPKNRKKWCSLIRRDDPRPLSTKSTLYCCEDHFDVETDMENYQKFKMMGGLKKLKKGVMPHKFACQGKDNKTVEKPGYKKRQQIELLESALNPDILHENLIPQSPIFQECGTELDTNIIDPLSDTVHINSPNCLTSKCVGVQVNIKTKYRSKATNTDSDTYDLLKPKVVEKPKREEPLLDQSTTSKSNSSYTCTISLESFCTEDERTNRAVQEKMENEFFKKHMLEGTLKAIARNTKLFLGLPRHSYSCVEYLCGYIEVPFVDILITLRKIRWREPNSLLAVHFGVVESTVAKSFKETLPKVAQCMQQLVFMPSRNDIRLNLPLPFRKRYSKVMSIIDCFEIQIEKPSTAVTQALTWSQYKNANTIKYLISITPDGFINFISEGYGGRTSDALIFEDCGLLNFLSPGDVIMADRGFKNIAHLLERQGCVLLRPPSVSSGTTLSKEEVLETKRIAALRIHVERTIGRLREFEMISPHACIDINYIKILDFIVISACGIVNLQDSLIK